MPPRPLQWAASNNRVSDGYAFEYKNGTQALYVTYLAGAMAQLQLPALAGHAAATCARRRRCRHLLAAAAPHVCAGTELGYGDPKNPEVLFGHRAGAFE